MHVAVVAAAEAAVAECWRSGSFRWSELELLGSHAVGHRGWTGVEPCRLHLKPVA